MNRTNDFRFTLVLLTFLACAVAAQAQRRNARYVEYIEKYAPLAVQQMKEHKIPASITLAQGLLESGAGQSTLARKSNNHFGIKCGSNWRGRTVRHDDDARNECFRAYSHPRYSYEDHSAFLKQGARYAFLFRLKTTDYKGWARGLKKAGYATDPSYANRLITIIEDYHLYKYDSHGMSKREMRRWEAEMKKKPWLAHPHQVDIANDIAYVVARDGDTFRFLGKEFGISWTKLAKYNDLQKDYTLENGDIIYLKSKKTKASKPHVVYVVKDGDSMHSISQKYGIRLKNLYKMNRKDAEYVPEVGDRLRLR
ncbi:MAG: glucosaminidase domain-containing protein [Bacteroides sp.]|nr:glucosaminidase domain-containing protein [Bacteroides sp.]